MVFWRRSWISEAVAFRFDDEVALRFVAEPTPPFGVLVRDDIAKQSCLVKVLISAFQPPSLQLDVDSLRGIFYLSNPKVSPIDFSSP